MFNKIIIGLIFLITAVTITGLVWMFSNWAKEDYCTHTQIQKLQDSGDYYSCLGVK